VCPAGQRLLGHAGELTRASPDCSLGESVGTYLAAVGIKTKLRTMARTAFQTARNTKQLRGLCVCASARYGNAATRLEEVVVSDVRVRRAISIAVDRQALIDAVYLRGEPSPALPRGLAEWSLPIDQLGTGAKYYQHNPKEAKQLLAEAGHPRGLKTQLTVSSGYGRDLIDTAQLVQRYLKDVGIEAELKIQEYRAYQATTGQGKFDGMALGPFAVGWEADSSVYGPYAPDQPRNRGHVNDPKITAMVQEQRRTKDPAARKQILSDFQRYAAEQQYYVYLFSQMITSSWQPYLKNYAHNLTFDYGSRIAVSWLDR
jgi:peptide/nickel transport system substrate-binding protein